MSRRILFVIDHLRVGGAQESLYQWVRYLHPRWQVTVYSLLCDAQSLYVERLRQAGAQVICLSLAQHEAWRILPRLTSRISRKSFDLVITLLQRSFALATPLSARAGLPTVHILMANHLQTERWYFPLMRWYAPFVTAFLTYDWPEAVGQRLPLSKVKAVELPFDISPFTQIQHDAQIEIPGLPLSNRYPVILSVGRLHPDKGHQFAIHMIKTLRTFYPQATLVVVGGGPYEDQLRKLVRTLRVEDHVIFAGVRTDLDVLFARGDVFVRTVLKEGSNTTLAWAMAAGIPVVGFDTGVPKDFLVHEVSGLVVPLGDAQAMAQAVRRILEDTSLRHSLTARARSGMLAYYNLDRILACYDRIFTDLASGKDLAQVKDMRGLMWPWYDPFRQEQMEESQVEASIRLG